MKVIKSIVLAIGAIIAFPFIIIGVALGVIVASAKAVVKTGMKSAPVVKSVGAKEREPVIDKPIIDFNKFPFGREDRGGTA